MNIKKYLGLLLAGSMSLSLLSGCGTGAASSAPAASGSASSGSASSSTQTEGSDIRYIQEKGTFVIGITDFAPMDYKEEGSDEWIGFDADIAKAFAQELGVTPEFVEINWDNKIMELDTKGVDCIWNGMTLTDEVTGSMSCSNPYCKNAQVVVVSSDKADQYQTLDSIKELNFAVESGSAGQAIAESLGLKFTAVQSQANALMEVASGASDACVIDLLMAGAMIGDGTSYPNLTHTVNLTEANGEESEVYGVGFRKGSDLTEFFNAYYQTKFTAGTIKEIATTYGVQEALIDPATLSTQS